MYYLWSNFCSWSENIFKMEENDFTPQCLCGGIRNKGTDVKGGAIDLLRVPDSQINSPILYATNHSTEE